MATTKKPFGGKQAPPFGKKGDKGKDKGKEKPVSKRGKAT